MPTYNYSAIAQYLRARGSTASPQEYINYIEGRGKDITEFVPNALSPIESRVESLEASAGRVRGAIEKTVGEERGRYRAMLDDMQLQIETLNKAAAEPSVGQIITAGAAEGLLGGLSDKFKSYGTAKAEAKELLLRGGVSERDADAVIPTLGVGGRVAEGVGYITGMAPYFATGGVIAKGVTGAGKALGRLAVNKLPSSIGKSGARAILKTIRAGELGTKRFSPTLLRALEKMPEEATRFVSAELLRGNTDMDALKHTAIFGAAFGATAPFVRELLPKSIPRLPRELAESTLAFPVGTTTAKLITEGKVPSGEDMVVDAATGFALRGSQGALRATMGKTKVSLGKLFDSVEEGRIREALVTRGATRQEANTSIREMKKYVSAERSLSELFETKSLEDVDVRKTELGRFIEDTYKMEGAAEAPNLSRAPSVLVSLAEKVLPERFRATSLRTSAVEILQKRHDDYMVNKLEATRIAKRWESLLPESDLQDPDIIHAIEKTGNPKIEGDTLLKLRRRLTPEKKQIVMEYARENKRFFDQVNKYAKELTGDEYITFLDDYVTHMWKVSGGSQKSAQSFTKSWRATSPAQRKRRIPTYADVEAWNKKHPGVTLEPRTYNVAEIFRTNADVTWRGATNKAALAHAIRLTDGEGRPAIARDGAWRDVSDIKYITMKAPPALQYLMGQNGRKYTGNIAIHPELKQFVDIVENRTFDSSFAKNIERFNMWAKKSELMFSFFHNVSLAYSANAVLANKKNPLRGLFLSGEIDPSTGEKIKFMSPHKVGLRLLENPDFVEQIMRANMNLKPLSDMQVQAIQKQFRQMGEFAKDNKYVGAGAEKAINRLANVNKWYDHKLWDRYFTGLKAFSYYDVMSRELTKLSKAEAKGEPITPVSEVRRDVGEYLNNAFGGQNFETMLNATPRTMQLARMLMLAPDWTLSNMKVAGKLFTAKNPRERGLYAKYWRNMIPTLAGSIVSLQVGTYLAFGDEEEGDNMFPWQNEKGRRGEIDVTPLFRKLPWHNPQDTRRKYISMGKQVREVLRWLNPEDASKQLFAKSSPAVHLAWEQVAQTFSPTYPKPTSFGGDVTTLKSPLKEIGGRALSVGQKFIPFSVSGLQKGTQFAFAVPMKKGASKWAVTRGFEDALNRYALPDKYREYRDVGYQEALDELAPDVAEQAILNGYDPVELVTRAMSKKRSEFYGKLFESLENEHATEDHDKWALALLRLHASAKTIQSSLKSRGIVLSYEEMGLLEDSVKRASEYIKSR